MKVEEYNPEHYQWTLVDNADQSVFAFERTVGDSDLLFVFNMTPNYYETYDVGVYHEGEWRELFNSDKDVYGGNNQYNGLPCQTMPGAPEGRPYHVTIKLGSFAALILKRVITKPKTPIIGTPTKEKKTKTKSSKRKTSVRKRKAK